MPRSTSGILDRALDHLEFKTLRHDAGARIHLIADWRRDIQLVEAARLHVPVTTRVLIHDLPSRISGAISPGSRHLTFPHLEEMLDFHGRSLVAETSLTGPRFAYHERKLHLATGAIALELLLLAMAEPIEPCLIVMGNPLVSERLSRMLDLHKVPHAWMVCAKSRVAIQAGTEHAAPLTIAAIAETRYPQDAVAMELLARQLRETPPDVLVLAGDIADFHGSLDRALSYFDEFEGAKFFIPGHREYHRRRRSAWERFHAFVRCNDPFEYADVGLERLVRRRGFHPLWMSPRRHGHHMFVGNTLWYDYSFNNLNIVPVNTLSGPVGFSRLPHPDYLSGELRYVKDDAKVTIRWPDRHQIAGEWYDKAICERQHRRLEQQLKDASIVSDSLIVVTHMAPFVEVLPETRDPYQNFGRAFLGSYRTEELLLKYRHKIAAVIHAHGHRGAPGQVQGFPVHSATVHGSDARMARILVNDPTAHGIRLT